MFNSVLGHWLSPSAHPCNATFFGSASETATMRLGKPYLVVDDNVCQESIKFCGGIRIVHSCREFDKGPPWTIPIFLGYLAITGRLQDPQELHLKLNICDTQYYLGGLTFWNGVHFTARFLNNGNWFDYDGLNLSSLLKPVSDVTAPISVGYIISSCVYFKEMD